MADAAGVCATKDAREEAAPFLRQGDPHHAHPVAQKTVDDLGEVGELVDDQDVDLGALIFEPVLLVLAVAEIDLRAVPEPDLVLDDIDEAAAFPARQQRPKPVRAFHVVLDQIVAQPPEEIDLQAPDQRAPDYRGDPHQVRLAAAGGASVEDLGGLRIERALLLGVELEIQLGFSRQRLCGGCH